MVGSLLVEEKMVVAGMGVTSDRHSHRRYSALMEFVKAMFTKQRKNTNIPVGKSNVAVHMLTKLGNFVAPFFLQTLRSGS